MTNVVTLLQKLVKIDSRNSLPLEAEGIRETDEMAMWEFLVAHLTRLGLTCHTSYAAPRRPNLVATGEIRPGRPTLAFQAHMDTVGTDGMSHDPFSAEIREGRLYGRGACDTKGGMAAMLVALEQLLAEQPDLNLMFVATCSEETGCEGAPFLDLSEWSIDGMIVGEPTSNQAIYAHKTHLTYELSTTGVASHGSRPEAGVNAIYRMAAVIDFLQQTIIPELAAQQSPGFSGSTLSVGKINGGVKANIVPEHCLLTVDSRLVPNGPTNPEQFVPDVARRATESLGFPVEIQRVHIAPSLGTPLDAPVLLAVRRALRKRSHDDTPQTVNYCTDGGVFEKKGIPCVILGPGNILQAHGAVEYIEVDELREAVEIYSEIAREFTKDK